MCLQCRRWECRGNGEAFRQSLCRVARRVQFGDHSVARHQTRTRAVGTRQVLLHRPGHLKDALSVF